MAKKKSGTGAGNGALAMPPPPPPKQIVTSVVEFSGKYDAINDQVVDFSTNIEGGGVDVILLHRILSRIELQTIAVLLAQRDAFAGELQNLKTGGNRKNGNKR